MLKTDTPIEVNAKQYRIIMNEVGLRGTCAGREADGKFYIKLWDISSRIDVIKALSENK